MSGVDGAMPLAVRMQIRKELLDQDDRFIQNIPKVELHVHIEGTLSPELRWELAQRNGMTLKIERTGVVHESLEHLRTFYEVPEAREGHSFDDDEERFTFFEAYYGGFEVLRTEQDFYDLAMNYFTQAASMRVRYCEPFFDPQGHTRRGVSWDTMMGGLCRAREAAKRELGVSSNWIMCILRDMSPESAMEHYKAALHYRDAIIGIGLDSDEHNNPPSLFDDVYTLARRDGFRLTAHCDVGMSEALVNIRQVASTLGGSGADRIDHGLNAATSESLMALIKERNVGMTLTPFGYVRHQAPDEIFPRIRALYEAGIRFSIASDDPAYMGDCWILHGLLLVKRFCNFTDGDMAILARNAVYMCWAPQEVKAAILAEIEAVVATYSG